MKPVVQNETDPTVLLGPISLNVTNDNVLYHAYLDQPKNL